MRFAWEAGHILGARCVRVVALNRGIEDLKCVICEKLLDLGGDSCIRLLQVYLNFVVGGRALLAEVWIKRRLHALGLDLLYLSQRDALQGAVREALCIELVFVDEEGLLLENEPSLDLCALPLNVATEFTFVGLLCCQQVVEVVLSLEPQATLALVGFAPLGGWALLMLALLHQLLKLLLHPRSAHRHRISGFFNGVVLALWRWLLVDADADLLGIAPFLMLLLQVIRVLRYRLILALILDLLGSIDRMPIALSTLVLRLSYLSLDLFYAYWSSSLMH